jgi:hypothetical protein
LIEEYRPRISENRLLRRKFGPKREEAAGQWRKLHNEELLVFWYAVCGYRHTHIYTQKVYFIYQFTTYFGPDKPSSGES